MKLIRGIFVVGTDTGVGKTIITAALTAALRAENRNVGIWKPVQSGELLGSGATDVERLLRYTGFNEQPEAVATFTFEAPLTPLLAAKQAGVTLTLQGLAAAGGDLLHRYESLLIEGAGGVAVPLTDDALMVDLISELRIPALIVARSGLGTINHTLLTISCLRENGVPIIGFIFNDVQSIDSSDDPSVTTNAELIERYSGIKFLGHFPYLKGEINRVSLIHAVREQIQLETITQALTIQTNGGMSEMTTIKSKIEWSLLAEKALKGECLTVEEGLAVLESENEDILSLMHAAFQVRQHFYGKKVKLNMIINAKSGHCPEDCGYCSQSIVSTAPVQKYTLLDKKTLLAGAREAMARKAGTYCIVASGKGPTEKELDQVVNAVKEIRATMPLKICACLGILKDGQAERLAEAGVHRYNHNLNTSKHNYSSITTTHSYEQRVETVEKVKAHGMSPCSGVIIGMGESNQEIVEMAYALRELDAESIPINFLNAIPGTPLAEAGRTPAMKGLKVLALFRFICPSKEIRVAGGREVNLRTLQPLSLYAANSLFVGDYLTTAGQDISADHQIIEDLGFEIELNAL